VKNHTLQILIVDDDEGDRKQIKRAITQSNMSAECSETASIEHALLACSKCEFDCAIVDYRLPGEDGLEGITALRETLPNMAIVMSTGQGDEAVATEAMKRGAADYISKSRINAVAVSHIIENALQKVALHSKIKQQQDELENFARVLAHDLRAPAASIETFATRIVERLEEGNQDEALKYADWVIQRAQRMSRLIDTLHKYTMADSKVDFETVDMNQVFAEASANLQNLIQETGAKLSASPLPAVAGNTSQLIQLLQNLIGNGIKYCDSPIPAIHLDAAKQAEDACLFRLTDNGIGIPEAYYKKIFNPFVRASNAGKRDGTGLGLATCRKIVERHGGKIWCESTTGSAPASGTTFFFTLQSIPSDPTTFPLSNRLEAAF
jgi:signal transduction histidine kinase